MKDTFIMYNEWDDMIEELSELQRGELLLAIMRYQTGGEIPDLSPCARIAFAQIKMQFKKDEKKYQEQVHKKKEASKIGVEARRQKQSNGNQPLPRGNQPLTDGDQMVSVCDSDSVCDSVCDGVGVGGSENQKKENGLKPTREKFVPPTVEEVAAYCAERGNAVDAESFVDFYQSKGWMVGKNRMKDWKSAVRNWERTDSRRQGQAAEPDRYEEVDRWASAISQRS